METQIGTKCVSKLQQITSTSIGSSARVSSAALRRNSAGCPPAQQHENSWPRPPFSRSHLSVPRRSNLHGQQHLWLQRPAHNRTSSSNDWKFSSDADCEKKNMTPQAPVAQPPQQQTQTKRERNPSASVELKQTRLEQRALSIANRLRRLQYGQSRSHIESELNSAKTSLRRALDNAVSVRDAETLNDVRALLNDGTLEQKLESLIKMGELRPEALNCEDLRHATPSAMAEILKKHESLLKKVISLSSSSSSADAPSNASSSSNSLPPNVALDLEDQHYLGRVTQSLQSHLTALQRDYDSDATESSSGGESCDEDEMETELSETKPSGKFRHTTLQHRASWQWWTERAWLGSRWAWVQFQLADLEYKIRQHADLYKQLRCRKQKQTSALTSALNKNGPDGLNTKIRAAQRTCDGESTDADETAAMDGCARTRPFELAASRRRIIRTAGMFRWSRKTLVQSSVHCGCFPPFSPCVMCSGRLDNVEPVNVRWQTRPVRNAILEPAYHAVLSVPYRGKGIGLERKLQTYWATPKPAARNFNWFPQQKTIVTLLPHSRENQESYVKESLSAGTSPEKSRRRKKPDGPILTKRSYSMANRHRSIAKLKRAKKFKREWRRSDLITASGSLLSAALQDDNGTSAGKLGSRRTTERHSTFDINNIVVDPRVAAVTRVEKLQYKEIQTPEWRMQEYPELSLAQLAQEKEMEDISDAAIGARHSIKEGQEKKRFIPILFRDLHSAARRSQLLSQSSSVDSNGSAAPNTPPISHLTSTSSAPAGLGLVSIEKPSFSAPMQMELSYDPFPPRHFPLEGEAVEEICNGYGSFSNEKSASDSERAPSV